SGPHALMPGFSWNGTDGVGPLAIGQQLWRAYVFSDKRCINEVMIGSITGAPAWAPRAGPALALPATVKDLTDTEQNGKILKYGDQGAAFMADITPVIPSENDVAATTSTTSTTTP